MFMPFLEKPFAGYRELSFRTAKDLWVAGAALMKVFMPYLVWNTVFDNTRVTAELGRKPVPFSRYSYPLLKFSRENQFKYRYKPWPAAAGGSAA